MGRASKAKRDRRSLVLQGTGASRADIAKRAAYLRERMPASPAGARFAIEWEGCEVGGHELLVACLLKDDTPFLTQLEAIAQREGCTLLDLLFTHPIGGFEIDPLALAVSLEAEACVQMLTVIAGQMDRGAMLVQHLNRLIMSLERDDGSPVTAFARRHLKDHFVRSRKRGAENIGALLAQADQIGYGAEAARLLGEIEAEELASIEVRDLEDLLAPAPKSRSSVRAL